MKQFVVIGLGRFGSSVARTLSDNGHDVLAIDKCEECVDELVEYVTHAVEADATDETALSALGVNNFDTAVVSIGDNVHANILATLILKEMGVPQVVAKAQDKMHGKILSRVGADKVVYPERDMGERVARQLISTNMLDYIDFAPDYSIIEIIAPSHMVGKTLQDLNFRKAYNANVMAIRRGKNLNLAPGGQDKVLEGDTLIIMGHNDQLEDLKEG
ncbi:MAG: potassium channel family protein [Bacillota bacterium]